MERRAPDPESAPEFNLLFNKHSQIPSVLAAASCENPCLRSRSRSSSGTRHMRSQRAHSSPPRMSRQTPCTNAAFKTQRTTKSAADDKYSSSRIHISDIDLIVRSMLEKQMNTMRSGVMGEVDGLRRELATLRSAVTEKDELLRRQDERFAQIFSEQSKIIAHGGSEITRLKAYIDSNIQIERNKRLLLSKKLYKKLSSDIKTTSDGLQASYTEVAASMCRTNDDVSSVKWLLRRLEEQLAAVRERPAPHSPHAVEESKAAECSAIEGESGEADLTRDSDQYRIGGSKSAAMSPSIADVAASELQQRQLQWELMRVQRKLCEVASTSGDAVSRLSEGVADVQEVTLKLVGWAHRLHGHLRIPRSLVPPV